MKRRRSRRGIKAASPQAPLKESAAVMDEALRGLRLRFGLRCADDLVIVRQAVAWAGPAHSAGHDPELQVVVHRLRGAAAMMGHRALGDIAAEVEDEFLEGRRPSSAMLLRLEAALVLVVDG